MDTTTAIILTIIAILFSGLFSGMEIAFVQSNKVRMEIDATKGGLINRIISIFNRNQDMYISSILVGNNVVLVIYGITISILINPILQGIYDNEAFMLISNTVFSTGVILITGEFIPKATFKLNPNGMLRFFALPIYLIYIILYPISLFTSTLSKGIMKIFGIKSVEQDSGRITMDEIDDYIQQTIDEQENKAEVETELKIFKNAINFKDTLIRECMIPRNEMVAVDVDETSKDDLLKLFISTGLSKIVVYKEDIDDVKGYIHISELFNTNVDWKNRIKPVIFTPQTMLANKMMHRLMAEKKSMAIVVDEFGGTSGLVTLEDIVEEIFGEIEDEHDRQQFIARRLNDVSFEFSGRVEIEHINENFGLEIKESEEYHTIAGFILVNRGELPSIGDSFEIDNLKFEVLKMTSTKIELVRIEKLPEKNE